MKNTKLYPFERNRYYPGKMLTSADFQAEQAYFNNKRRFINSLMYGAGVVCGCGVFSLDDLSILVESGVAIDRTGREIVIESSVVKKLSAIEGFETLKSDFASLCLRYKEEPVHTVYTTNQNGGEDGGEYEYNRISEGYQLFLLDQDEASMEYEMETEFLASAALFEGEDFAVRLVMPATVCQGKNVKLKVVAEKCSARNRKLTYHAVLQAPMFLTSEGSHEVEVDLEDILLKEGESLEKEYWLQAGETMESDTSILLKSGTARVFIDDAEVEALSACSLKVLAAECGPRELVNQEIGRMSLEMRDMGGAKDYIRLADLRLERTESAYIIEEVMEKGVKRYIAAPAQEMLRGSYLEYFVKEPKIFKEDTRQQAIKEQEIPPENGKVPEVATGILEIPLGGLARRGGIFYSGEIMHGLGKGNVYVELGCEYIADDPSLGVSAKNTIYGNPKLFPKEKALSAKVETSVKVMNDKGSFVAAAMLLENIDCLVLTYRWVAIKFPAGNDLGLSEDYSGKSISTDTPTVVLGTRESHYFHVRFHDMESCSIAYELTESGSGEISSDGVYTAPAKEGVYEIRIYCTEMPIICTYAYAIVRRKGYAEPESERGEP